MHDRVTKDDEIDEQLVAQMRAVLVSLAPELRPAFVRLMAAMALAREQSQAVLRMADQGIGVVGVDVGVHISPDGQRVELYVASTLPEARGGTHRGRSGGGP